MSVQIPLSDRKVGVDVLVARHTDSHIGGAVTVVDALDVNDRAGRNRVVELVTRRRSSRGPPPLRWSDGHPLVSLELDPHQLDPDLEVSHEPGERSGVLARGSLQPASNSVDPERRRRSRQGTDDESKGSLILETRERR